MNYKNLTRNNMPGGFWRMSKPLLHTAKRAGEDGAHVALFFEDLLQQEKWVEENNANEYKRQQGAFFLLQASCETRTGLSPYQQRKAAIFLEKIKLLSVTKRGVPAKNYYTINHEQYHILLSKKEIIDSYFCQFYDDNGYPIPQMSKNLMTGESETSPLINKDNTNKDTKVSSGENAATTRREELKKAQGGKQRQPYSPGTLAVVTYWNELAASLKTKPRPYIHRTNTHTSTLDKIDTVVRALLAGGLQAAFPHELTAARLTADQVPPELAAKTWTLDEIKAALRTYVLHFQEGYWPFEGKNKARLPKSLALVFISERADSRPSWFLFDACHEIQQQAAALDPDVLKVLVQAYTKHRHRPTRNEEEGLRRAANEIVRFHRELDNSAVPYYSLRYAFEIGTVQRFVRKFSEFLIYYMDNERGDLDLHVGMLRPGSKTWDAFAEYLREHNVTIAMTEDEKKIAGALQGAVRAFRQEVNRHGLEICRKKYGERIPYLTQDEETKRATKWARQYPDDKYMAHEWGRGLWAEIKKRRGK